LAWADGSWKSAIVNGLAGDGSTITIAFKDLEIQML